MVKKKPFIDKKSASVYHVVRRSQRDVGTEATAETLSDFVLMPSPDNDKQRQSSKNKSTTNANVVTSISREDYNDIKRNPKSNKMDFNTIKTHIQKSNLHDTQSSTYSQYTKPISSNGTYLSSNILHEEDATNLSKLFTDNTNNELDTALTEAMAVHEADRMLDSIALTTDCLDDDMEEALFNYNEDEFEEILDDFCFTANLEVLDTDNDNDDNNGEGEFNYEQHIQQLMEKARKLDAGEYDNGGRDMDEEEANFFGGVVPLHGRIEEEDDNEDDSFNYDQYGEEEEEEDSLDREFNGQDDNNGKNNVTAAKLGDEEQRILCQKFEEALLEYDSDDVGDLDEECEEIVGDRPLEGDVQLEAALDEFLTDNQDDILIEGDKALMRGIPKHVNKRTGGSGYSALVGTKMVNADQLDQEKDTLLINIEESKKQMQKDLADADAILANPEVDLPPEEVFIDGKSYFTETSRSQWDCESILSTYSNLDNNPVVIGRRKKKKKKGKKTKDEKNISDVIPEDGPVKIQLSSKTGLPLGIFNNIDEQSPEQDDDDDYYYNDESETYISINRGEARDKSETKLEKKQRKVAIKEERKICRMQKKIMKEAFKEEFMKRGQDVIDNDVGGSTVFRF